MNVKVIDRVAHLVRREAEKYARELEYDDETLVSLCAVCSGALVAAYRAVGLVAHLAVGTFAPEEAGHFWVLVWSNVRRDAYIVDITATQFDDTIPPILRFDPGDPRRCLFRLKYTEDAAFARVRAQDLGELEELTWRSVAVVVACCGAADDAPAPAAPTGHVRAPSRAGALDVLGRCAAKRADDVILHALEVSSGAYAMRATPDEIEMATAPHRGPR